MLYWALIRMEHITVGYQVTVKPKLSKMIWIHQSQAVLYPEFRVKILNEIKQICSGAQWCLTLCYLIDLIVALQFPLSMEFSRQDCWNGLPFPPPGDFPDPGIKPMSPASPELPLGHLGRWTDLEGMMSSTNVKSHRSPSSLLLVYEYLPLSSDQWPLEEFLKIS